MSTITFYSVFGYDLKSMVLRVSINKLSQAHAAVAAIAVSTLSGPKIKISVIK